MYVEGALKFLDIIRPFMPEISELKMGDGHWGSLIEINKGPALLKLVMDPVKPYLEEAEEDILRD
jgi:hypothetical protein